MGYIYPNWDFSSEVIHTSMHGFLLMDSIGHRLNQILKKFWPEGQKSAAEDLGVAQASISRVVNDQRRPSYQLLDALLRKTGVDANWLMTGEGEEFLNAVAAQENRVPLAACLLPGLPLDHRDQLTSQTISVPSYLARDSVYAVTARSCLTVESSQLCHILPDDVLIIETDAGVWRKNIQLLNDRLCAVCFNSMNFQRIVLQFVHVGDPNSPDWLSVDTHAAIREHVERLEKSNEIERSFGRRLRGITLDDGSSNAEEPNSRISIMLSEVVGLVVSLTRTL